MSDNTPVYTQQELKEAYDDGYENGYSDGYDEGFHSSDRDDA